MKTLHALAAAALVAGAAASFAAPVQSAAAGSPTAAGPDAASLTEGEIRKVDHDSRKITIKHGAIRNLDMPPMTMVFHVRDAALLDQVHVGDKVRFAAVSDGGKLTLTQIQAAR